MKVVGRFAPLPIAASRTVALGGTVATVGFPIPQCGTGVRAQAGQRRNRVAVRRGG